MIKKIIVKTPKNQAEKCVNSQKDAILGYKLQKKVIEQKVVSHKEFYWMVDIEEGKEMEKVIKRAAAGEVMIKKFYRTLFRVIGRANKLAIKFNASIHWIRKWLIKKLNKITDGNKNDMVNHIKNMSDDELRDFIRITDREEMDKLLSGDLITVVDV